MKKNTENAIVNAIGELGVKLDHIETGLSSLNIKFDLMFTYLKENLDLKDRVERLEKEVFKK